MPAAAKNKTVYTCTQCGYESPKWYGKCPGCGGWNCMEEVVRVALPTAKNTAKVTVAAGSGSTVKSLAQVDCSDEHRYKTGMTELDRVLGGGLVKGSLVLISGDPGIGKSTILLQICEFLGRGLRILYVSGEESMRQIKLRAARLHVDSDGIRLLTETDMETVLEQIRQEKPDIVMIDSIQTMNFAGISSSSGSVTQVRECTNAIMHTAKQLEITTILVGHVNKDGVIAGPKVLEHIVDAVLYFEGDRQLSYRILRAVKNRYGSTNEIGVFEMEEYGLAQVPNPSAAMLAGRPQNASGTCVTCIIEGTRALLAEIQGLATTSGYGNARRMCTGFDYNRMSMILAVLEKRSGYYFSNLDAYINVVGGLRIDEPAVDLAVAMALVSSLKDTPIRDDTVIFGEIGLAGEIRSVSHIESRIAEAQRLGFKRCVLPYHSLKTITRSYDMKLLGAKDLRAAFAACTEND